jgi:hypothetical protein
MQDQFRFARSGICYAGLSRTVFRPLFNSEQWRTFREWIESD